MKDFDFIPDFVKKTNNKFIQNQYEILNPMNNDFGVVIYFLDTHKAHISIRKFNIENIGWYHSLEIKIYSSKNNQEYEIIYIGSSTKNSKKCNIFTQIDLFSKNNKILKIPQKIIQTYYQPNFHNESHKQVFHHLLELHPNFDYEFFDDSKVIMFIQENNKEYLKYYFSLYPCAYKADLFRYLYIYFYGGIYLDHKYILRQSFLELIKEDCEQLYCEDSEPNLLFNSIIISIAKNPLFLKLLEKIKNNINNDFYGNCPLHPTGPRLFGEIMDHSFSYLIHKKNEKNKDYKNGKILIKKNNNIFLTTSYPDYYFNKNHRNQIKNDYDFCYRKKKIYVKNILIIDHYIFFIHIPKKINIQIIFLEKKKDYIVVQTIIQGIFENELKNNYFFSIYNLNNYKSVEYQLKNCFNKIIKIHI